MKTRGRRATARRVAGRDRRSGRRAHRGAPHAHGRAARPRRRQRARDHRVHRDAEGQRARRISRRCRSSSPRGCSCSAASSRSRARREARVRGALAVGRRPREASADHREPGWRSACRSTTTRGCRPRPIATASARRATASSRRSRRSSSGRAAVVLGAGRDRLDAVIDPAVGFMIARAAGTAVARGRSDRRDPPSRRPWTRGGASPAARVRPDRR